MGEPPFPLMTDWRKRLQSHLFNEVPSFCNLVGLNEDIDGPEFERRLGAFLREALEYVSSEDLILRSFELPFVTSSMNTQAISDWRWQFSNAINRLVDEIYQSSFNEFGRNNLYLTKRAEESYAALLTAIGIVRDQSTWAIATTNYDHVAELTLNQLGYHPISGEERVANRGGMFRLNAKRLSEFASPFHTPVLHLHGSVGWFLSKDGLPYGLDSVATYEDSLGLPIILLPDLSKDYGTIPLIVDIWKEFRSVLRRAQSVFVLGHSLNDLELRIALREDVGDGRRIAISAVTPNSEGLMRDQQEERLAMDLGLSSRPTIIPIVFGNQIEETTVRAIAEWKRRIHTI